MVSSAALPVKQRLPPGSCRGTTRRAPAASALLGRGSDGEIVVAEVLAGGVQQLRKHAGGQGFWTLLRRSFSAVSASALWVDFDGHEAVTVTMDYLFPVKPSSRR